MNIPHRNDDNYFPIITPLAKMVELLEKSGYEFPKINPEDLPKKEDIPQVIPKKPEIILSYEPRYLESSTTSE